MHNLTRALYLMIMVLLLASCRQQPAVTATPDAAPATSSPAPTALPTTPAAAQPTDTQTPAHTPTATAMAAATATITPTPSTTPTQTPAALPVSEEMTFELLAQEGGVVHSVAVAGNRVYVGAGPRVLALDDAGRGGIGVITRSEPLPGAVEALLAVQDGDALQLYAGAGESLVALAHDASGALIVQDTLPLPGWVSSLALGNDGVLFAGGAPRDAQYPEGDFIAMAGVKQPEALDLLQTVETPNHTSALAFARGALYSAHLGYTGARLMTTAIEEGQMATPEAVRGIERELYTLHVSGDTLLAGGYGALLALDVSTPGAPQHLWQAEEIDDNPLGMVNGIAHAAGQLYLSGWYPAGAYIPFRIAYTPPQPLGGAPGLPASNDVLASGSRLFIAENRQLEIHDIGRPGQLTSLGGYKPAFSGVSDLAIGQTATGEHMLYLYDASQYDSEPEALLSYRLPALELLSRYTVEEIESDTQVGQGTWFDLVVEGETVTLSAQSGLYQVDVSDPASPTIVANHPFTAESMDTNDLVQLDGAFYLAAAGLRPRINTISFENGAATETASFGNIEGSQIRAMTGSGNRIFVTSAAYPDLGWLQTIDVTDGFDLASTMALPGYPDAAVALHGNLLATTMGSRLALVDVLSPQAPAILADLLLPRPDADQRPVADLLFHDDLLFVVLYGQEVLVLDVAQPAQPRLVGSLPLPSTRVAAPVTLGLAGGHLVLASGTIGILLYDFERDAARASGVTDTPSYCPDTAPSSANNDPVRVYFVEGGNLRVWDEETDTTETESFSMPFYHMNGSVREIGRLSESSHTYAVTQ